VIEELAYYTASLDGIMSVLVYETGFRQKLSSGSPKDPEMWHSIEHTCKNA
jgi:hypothetical protein